MPTLAAIQSQSTDPLNLLEKEIVRHIVGINGRTSSAVYLDSEERFLLLTDEQNQLIRALVEEYEAIDNTTVAIFGGTDGLNVSFDRDRKLIEQQIRRVLYPTTNHDPATVDGTTGAGSITFIPVTYGNGSTEFD